MIHFSLQMKQKFLYRFLVKILEIFQKLLMILDNITFKNVGLNRCFLLNRRMDNVDYFVYLFSWFLRNHVVKIMASSNIQNMTNFSPMFRLYNKFFIIFSTSFQEVAIPIIFLIFGSVLFKHHVHELPRFVFFNFIVFLIVKYFNLVTT